MQSNAVPESVRPYVNKLFNVDANLPDRYMPVSIIGFVVIEILYAIPIIGLLAAIGMVVWGENENLRNYAIVRIGMIILSLIFTLLLGAGLFGFWGQLTKYAIMN